MENKIKNNRILIKEKNMSVKKEKKQTIKDKGGDLFE